MGKLVVIDPGAPARLVDHDGVVKLDTLYRYAACDCVDARALGPMPSSGRIADAWFDDEGLLKDESVPNRKIGPNTVVVGSIVICARNEEGDSLALTAEEAEDVVALVEAKWERLAPDYPKPEPGFTVTPL